MSKLIDAVVVTVIFAVLSLVVSAFVPFYDFSWSMLLGFAVGVLIYHLLIRDRWKRFLGRVEKKGL